MENKPKHLCVGCRTELKAVPVDILNFTVQEPDKYCPNKDCPRYGLVAVVAIAEEK